MSLHSRVRVGHLKFTVLFVAVALTALAHPLAVRTVGFDVWHVRQAEQDFQEAKRVEDQLNDACLDAQEQAQLSRIMVDDLIAGRAELSVVARQRWEMSQSRTGIRQYLEEHRTGPSLEAKMAHNLVERINEVCPDDVRPVVDERLRKQYELAYGLPLPGK